MRSETKRITGKALIELRQEMFKNPHGSDALVETLVGQIEMLKYQGRSMNDARLNKKLRKSLAQVWAKVDHLKVQMYKMSRGYEKKIKRLDKENEDLTEALFENTPIQ